MGELNAPLDVIRSPTPIAMQGTKARVYIAAPDHVVTGERISLVKGKDRAGNIELPVYEFSFAGRKAFDVPARKDNPLRVSDDLEIPLTPGLWYLQESASEKVKIFYFFDVDGGFRAKTSDAPGARGHDWRGGLVYRIDVLTTDRRPGVVCMGDSITQGYASTPNAGHRYPDILEKLIDRPVLNTGVNGDQLVEYGRQIGFVNDPVPLAGVSDAVFLMGTNDIIGGGRIKSIEDFKRASTACLNNLRHGGLRVIWGTILPATGYKDFDKNPANELLRKQANQFIREELHPDAVADFDAVMSDPDNPDRMRKDFHCGDWVHPNDAGYQAMAAEAARQLRGRDPKHLNSGKTMARKVTDIVSTITGVASCASAGIAVAAEEAAAPREESVILTPKPPATPRINGAKIFGVRPGHPFLFTIPATGQRPMEFAVENLPEGLTVDSQTGRISGSLKASGEYALTFHAKNAVGQSERKFKIVCGEKLALTPMMGWSTWYFWSKHLSDRIVRDGADAMVSSGLSDHGWSYLEIAEFWPTKPGSKAPMLSGEARDSHGNLNTCKWFPDMKGLADYIHGKGLKAGIYTSPGPLTCEGFVGAYQHEKQDARQFAAWRFDYLMYDWCSYEGVAKSHQLAALQKPYRQMGDILKQLDRDIVLKICQYGMGDVWKWGREAGGNCWRTGGDLGGRYRGIPASVSQVFDLYGRNELQKYAGPGGWNDPDNLLLGTIYKAGEEAPGNKPKPGLPPNSQTGPTSLSPNEQYAHMSLWCLLAAPLFFGGDVRQLDAFTLGLLSNDEVIEVDQDPLGKSALRVSKNGHHEVWAKDMEDGSKAVGLFNRGEGTQNVTAKWSDLGLTGKQTVRDLWRQKDLGGFDGQFSAAVGRHGVVLLRLRAGE